MSTCLNAGYDRRLQEKETQTTEIPVYYHFSGIRQSFWVKFSVKWVHFLDST